MRSIVLRDGLDYLEVNDNRVRLCRNQRDDDGYVVLLEATLPQLAELAAAKEELSLRDLLDAVDSHLATNEPSSVRGWLALSKAWQVAHRTWTGKPKPIAQGEGNDGL